jgi:hypothetical protein
MQSQILPRDSIKADPQLALKVAALSAEAACLASRRSARPAFPLQTDGTDGVISAAFRA